MVLIPKNEKWPGKTEFSLKLTMSSFSVSQILREIEFSNFPASLTFTSRQKSNAEISEVFLQILRFKKSEKCREIIDFSNITSLVLQNWSKWKVSRNEKSIFDSFWFWKNVEITETHSNTFWKKKNSWKQTVKTKVNSDFTWNQFWSFQKLENCHFCNFRGYEFCFVIFSLHKVQKVLKIKIQIL